MNLNYEEIAEAIESIKYYADEHDEIVKDIKGRLEYLMSQLQTAKQHFEDRDGGSELEYALGDIDNLLYTILSKL
mgnify:FL=1